MRVLALTLAILATPALAETLSSTLFTESGASKQLRIIACTTRPACDRPFTVATIAAK